VGEVEATPGSTGEPLIHALVMQVFTLATQTSTVVAALLSELDLTEALATALWRLDPDGAPPSMRALAATLGCDPSTVTFLVDRLEQRGLIQRQVATTDRRLKVIMLTSRGTRARARLVQALTASSPLASLSAAEQQQLYQLLVKAGADPAQFTCRATSVAQRTDSARRASQ
jgi:DNA-binding MarR family transcriptional regulator